ncbi:MAG: cytochrome c oxidase assembly factor Coa1 family protein [Pseudoxanthomonas sp.]
MPLLSAVLLTLFAGAILLLISGIFGMIKSSDAYSHSLQQAQRNPAVVAALGDPVKDGWLVMGNISVNGPTGEANLQIPISGPKAEGDLYVEATKSQGQWNYKTLLVRVDGAKESIDLLDESH